MFKEMKYDFEKAVDLSQTLENGMPIYEGNPVPSFERTKTLEKDGVNLSRLVMGSHTGTHVDAPRHFVRDGIGIDNIPVLDLMGEAIVLDLSFKPIGSGITAEELKQKLEGEVRPGDIVLCYTGSSDRWGDPEVARNYTYLTEEGARYLVSKKVRAFGIDFLSVEKFKTRPARTHQVLLEAGMFLVETLSNNLKKLTGKRIFFIAMPIKLKDGDGAPARCIGIPLS